MVTENLWLGGDDATAVSSALVPKLGKTEAAVKELLFEVATLEVALQVRAGGGRAGAHGALWRWRRRTRRRLCASALSRPCGSAAEALGSSLPRSCPPLTSPRSVRRSGGGLQANTDAVTLANLMPKHWADFIRNSPMDDVKPIGTQPLRL